MEIIIVRTQWIENISYGIVWIGQINESGTDDSYDGYENGTRL